MRINRLSIPYKTERNLVSPRPLWWRPVCLVAVAWWDWAESFGHINKNPQQRKCHGTPDPPTKKSDLTRNRHRFKPWPPGLTAFFTTPRNIKWCGNVDIFPVFHHKLVTQIKKGHLTFNRKLHKCVCLFNRNSDKLPSYGNIFH